MAPRQALLSSRVCVVAALTLPLAEAGNVKNFKVVAEHGLTSQGTYLSSQLARGSTARNVAAAQYAITANRGFFSWWPSFGWRSFIGWWASWRSTSHAASNETTMASPNFVVASPHASVITTVVSNQSDSLDAIVETGNATEHRNTWRNIKLSDEQAWVRRGARSVANGLRESLSESGYQIVASSRSEEAMLNFMRRAVANMGLEILDEETLVDVVKFYDGECATQSYRNLVEELRRAEHPYLCHRAWTAKVGKPAPTLDAAVAALADLGGHVVMGRNNHSANSEDPVLEASLGRTASLDEHGYQAVASTKSTLETMIFVERVLAALNLKVTDESGLLHFAPYYSGECARQSYRRLVKELKRAPTRPHSCGGGWVGEL